MLPTNDYYQDAVVHQNGENRMFTDLAAGNQSPAPALEKALPTGGLF